MNDTEKFLFDLQGFLKVPRFLPAVPTKPASLNGSAS